jgi:hypothetical protein
MSTSVVIDVTIGLILIYLLYSLLATAVQEASSSFFAFRARILAKGIERMLNDEPSTLRETFEHSFGSLRKFFEWLKALFIYTNVKGRNTLADRFYHEPLIKYQGAGKLFRKPSYITSENFSQALLQIFLDNGAGDSKTEKIKNAILSNGMMATEEFVSKFETIKEPIDALEKINKIFDESSILRDNIKLREYFNDAQASEIKKLSDNIYQAYCRTIRKYQENHLLIEPETRKQLLSFYDQSNGDLDKFRNYLEGWFDDTMERVSGWYKKRVQLRLFVWGLVLAFVFNVDTFQIVENLSRDDKARKQAAELAVAYFNSNKNVNSSDSALARKAYEAAVKSSLSDIDKANSVFSISYPWTPSDSLKAFNKAMGEKYELFKQMKLYGGNSDSLLKDTILSQYNDLQKTRYLLSGDTNKLRLDSLKKVMTKQQALLNATIKKKNLKIPEEWSWCRKLGYIFSPMKLFSFIITAMAISLGAPFWFDLLNKFVNIRGAGAKPVEDKKESKGNKSPEAAG